MPGRIIPGEEIDVELYALLVTVNVYPAQHLCRELLLVLFSQIKLGLLASY